MPTNISALKTALSLLADTTPLRQDCGALCAAACCRDDESEGLGMWLFPGEEALYTPDDSWAQITPSGAYREGLQVPMLLCEGSCPRERRPLACRIFPLGPCVRGGEVALRIDPRSRLLCPLADSGLQGLAPEFVHAAEAALAALWQDATQRAYLLWLSGQLDDYVRLLKRFRP